MSAISTCPACQQRFKLPETTGQYRCPKCQTPIEVRGPQPIEAKAGNAGSARAGSERRREKGRRGQSDEQRSVAADVRRIANRLKAVRAIFVVIAMVAGVGVLARGLRLSETGDSLGFGIQLGWFLVLVIASIQVIVQPLLWTVVAAVITAPVAAFAINSGSLLNPITLAVTLTWIFLIGMILTAWQLRGLLREHPDLQITRTLVAERGKLRRVSPQRAVAGATTEHARQRRRTRSGSRRGLWIAFGATVLVVAVVAGAFMILNRPPAIEDTLTAFRTNWNESAASVRVEKVASFFAAESESKMTRRIQLRFERFGWDSETPRLDEPTVSNAETGSATVRFPMQGGGELTTYWSLDESEGWQLRGLKYPKGR